MSKNKRIPKELMKYVLVVGNNANYECRYFPSQKTAKEYAKVIKASRLKKRLFKIDYDFYGDV